MNTPLQLSDAQDTPETVGRRSGFTLGRALGVEIHIDWSLTIIFVLILFSLATSWFPRWHRDWSVLTIWASALAAALLFLGSVLLHELSHALVARRHGMSVKRITLFMFGGLAHVEEDAPSAGVEFKMAVVGPIVSIGIGLVATALARALAPQAPQPEDAAAFFSSLGPVASIFAWLGMINLALGIFNLIPGFPLDGGRVLRAGLWRLTGDRRKATRWASYMGRVFAAVLVSYGILVLFAAGRFSGVWWILMGWFLYMAAKGSYQQLVMRESLEDVPVREVMRTSPATVPDDLPLSELVQNYIMATDQRTFPVVQGDRLLGMVSLEDVRKIPRDSWDRVRVTEVMTPAARLSTLSPDDEAADAFRQIATRDIRQIPVVENGHLAGVIRREDLMKWLSLQHPQRH